MWKWAIWLILIVGSFACMEGWALYHDTPTLSRWVWNVSAAFPPFGWLAGLITGFLACHFWWGGIVSFKAVGKDK